MKVSVIGLGYVGLPTAAVLASRGIEVVGVDVNPSVVQTINLGNIHIVEPDLDMIVRAAVTTGHLRAATSPEPADAFLVAVPTPFKGDHKPDLTYIEAAAKAIAPVLEKGNLVVLESTSPVGATEKMVTWMKTERPDLVFPDYAGEGSRADVSVAHCPERVMPGQVMHELLENDRIIGGMTAACATAAQAFYKRFVQGECLVTDARTAELSKLAENSFRDVNIAFANELSVICDRLGINAWELIGLANRHPRVSILKPGPGVGGHCIAVDPWFIVDSAPEEANLIRTARSVNDGKPGFVLKKIDQAARATGKQRGELTIACLGLSFKANIDDLRESPALEIAKQIRSMGFAAQHLVEPNISEIPDDLNGPSIELSSAEHAVTQSDIVVLLVDHAQFNDMDLGLLSGKQVVDTRGVWSGAS